MKIMSFARTHKLSTYYSAQEALKDKSPYVRKTAAMAVAKIYHVSPEHVEDLTDTLYTMIKDRSPMVCANQFPKAQKSTHTQNWLRRFLPI